MATRTIPNINVGVQGHVDCGKTTLVKAISTCASTACFDKNPQSQKRGITLDLGFSSFVLDNGSRGAIRFTLVDCPGHASLIRTIIGGAQIIDLVILVIDATKGVQTQTAECIVISEVTCNKVIVVLNKIDMIPAESRATKLEKLQKKLRLLIGQTSCELLNIVAVSAKNTSDESKPTIGLNDLKTALLDASETQLSKEMSHSVEHCVMAVDHCFCVRGQGTVATGTILMGVLKIGDSVEICGETRSVRKVKSIQMYKESVTEAKKGDRVGVCVTQFDPTSLERGYLATPGYLQAVYAAVVSVKRIKYFKFNLTSRSRLHITVGYDTTMAKIVFFSHNDRNVSLSANFNSALEYQYIPLLQSTTEKDNDDDVGDIYALLEFERPVCCIPNALFIASKLDIDSSTNMCRLAFHGHLLRTFCEPDYSQSCSELKVFKTATKQGLVDRLVDERTIIVKDMFKKETNISLFSGLEASLSSGERGRTDSPFGLSGKVKVLVPDGLKPETQQTITSGQTKGKSKRKSAKSSDDGDSTQTEQSRIFVSLSFKKYIFSCKKSLHS